MLNNLLDKYEKELKYKISLKMIPNKTEEQIMYQNFKFFDLEGLGFLNIRDFIRANEKIGVVLSHVTDFQTIFDYFDTDKTGVINYRQFCKNIFLPRDSDNDYNQNINQQEQNYDNYSVHTGVSHSSVASAMQGNKRRPGPFFDKLCKTLIQNGGARSMVSLFKEFKVLDFNNAKRLTIDDFIKIITENKISLSISDIQFLFHSYELNNNGFFYYEELFKDLKNVFWNPNRAKFINELFGEIVKIYPNGITINNLREMYDPKNHPYAAQLGEGKLKEDFQVIVDSYISIKRMNRGNFKLSKNDFEDFFKYFSFGIETDNEFIQIVSNCFYLEPINNETEENNNYNNNMNNNDYAQQPPMRNYNNNNYNNNYRQQSRPKTPNYSVSDVSQKDAIMEEEKAKQIENVIKKIKNNLRKLGIKTFFNLIKQFKYYDNGTKLISKYDFSKVLKDFRLNLTIHEIEKIFDFYCTDRKKIQMNYIDFINNLTINDINDTRLSEIRQVYKNLERYAKSIGETVTSELVKSLYWAKNNIFGLDETLALNTFCDNFDLFHECIKANKTPNVSLDEFTQFYQMCSFIVESDAEFSKMLNTEWKKIINTEQEFKEKNYYDKDYNRQQYNNNNEDNDNKINNIVPQRPRTPISNGDIYSNLAAKGSVIENDMEQNVNEYESNEVRQNLRAGGNQNNFRNIRRDKSEPKIRNNNRSTTPLRVTRVDALQKITNKLKRRGIRGLMNLHKQFIFTTPNLSNITIDDFIKVLMLQRIELVEEDYEFLFKKFCQENDKNFLNFPNFIRAFKKVLNEERLNAVERAFTVLDVEQTENLFIDDIKLKFNPKGNPDYQSGKKNEDEIITEFLDCFELNYNLLTTAENPETSNMVSFEEFANFYEYVSFLYEDDQEFINLVEDTWMKGQ